MNEDTEKLLSLEKKLKEVWHVDVYLLQCSYNRTILKKKIKLDV